jgi:hypothetical protein
LGFQGPTNGCWPSRSLTLARKQSVPPPHGVHPFAGAASAIPLVGARANRKCNKRFHPSPHLRLPCPTRCEVDDGVVASRPLCDLQVCRRDRLGIGIFATNMEARDLRKQLTIVPI